MGLLVGTNVNVMTTRTGTKLGTDAERNFNFKEKIKDCLCSTGSTHLIRDGHRGTALSRVCLCIYKYI